MQIIRSVKHKNIIHIFIIFAFVFLISEDKIFATHTAPGGPCYDCNNTGSCCPGSETCWSTTGNCNADCHRQCSGNVCANVGNGGSCDTENNNSCSGNANCCTNSAPGAPVLVSPTNGATVNGSSATVSWSSGGWGTRCSGDIKTYDVFYKQIATGGTCPVTDPDPPVGTYTTACSNLPQTTTTCTISGLTDSSTYCWYVKANNFGYEDSNPWKFSVCVPTGPASAPTLVAPNDNASLTTVSPTLQWSAPSSWGNNCSLGTNQYKIYHKQLTNLTDVCPAASPATYTLINTVPSTQTSIIDAGLPNVKSYCWYVEANNGASGVNSTTRKFTTPRNVTGKVWDATSSSSCTTATNVIPDPSGNSKVQEQKNGLLSGSLDSQGNYTLNNIPVDPASTTDSFCALNLDDSQSIFSYKLKCLNGAAAPPGCGQINLATTSTADLGYKKTPIRGWFQTNLGDVYANYTPTGVSLPVPPDGSSTWDATAHMIDSTSTVTGSSYGLAISKGSITVSDSSGNDKTAWGDTGYQNYKIENYSSTTSKFIWPTSVSFAVPSGAIDASTVSSFFSNASTGQVYYTTPSYFNTLMGADRIYTFSGSGAVVLYISGDITFSNKLTTSGNNRLILVVNGKVTISENLPATDPVPLTTATATYIDAQIIAKNGIDIPCESSSGSCTQLDTTMLINGSLLSQSYVRLKRDKGVNNDFPGEFIKYNPTDLIYLNNIEINSAVVNKTGLFTSDVRWSVN